MEFRTNDRGLRSKSRISAHAMILFLCGVASCSPSEETPMDAEFQVSAHDSSGAILAESRRALWESSGRWRIADTAEFVAGEFDAKSETPVFFSNVRDIAVLPSGSVLVLDGGLVSLFVFDKAGRLLKTIGRKGDGPGEFKAVSSVFPCTDGSLLVSGRNLSRFDSEGRFVARKPKTSRGRRIGVIGATPDCTRYLVQETGEGPRRGERGLSYSVLSWTDFTLESLDTIAKVPAADLFRGPFKNRPLGVPVPWTGVQSNIQMHGERVITGWGAIPEWRVFAPDGSLERVVSWGALRKPISNPDRRRYWDRQRLFTGAYGRNDDTHALFPPLEAFPSLPSEKPVFDGMLVDSEGNVWLRRWPDDYLGLVSEIPLSPGAPPETWRDSRWEVFEPTGRWLGRLDLPPLFQLLFATSEHLYGVQKDTLGTPVVKSFRILKRSGEPG